jgi:hypothetical protein
MVGRQVGVDFVKGAAPLQLRWCRPPRVEFVQMPTQPADDASAFGDEVFTMVDSSRSSRSSRRDRQIRFP